MKRESRIFWKQWAFAAGLMAGLAAFLVGVMTVSGLIVGTILRPEWQSAPRPPVNPRGVQDIVGRIGRSADNAAYPVTVPTPVGAFVPASRAGAPPSDARLRRLVAQASNGQAHVLRIVPGPGRLTTLVVQIRKTPMVVLTDGRYLFTGAVYDASGHNLIKRAVAQIVAAADNVSPAPAPAAAHAPNLQAPGAGKAHPFPSPADASFVVGRAGPTVTMVADPNCAYCHAMWESILRPEIRAGHLRVRIVPVGIVDPRVAIVRAAAILASPNPAKAWILNERLFHVSTEQGGFPAHGPFDPANAKQRAVLLNTEAFFAAEGGSVATPTFFYHGQSHVGVMTHAAWHRFLSTPSTH